LERIPDSIVKRFREGQSIKHIADDIYLENKSLKEKITKKEAHEIVEKIICDYVLKEKREVMKCEK